ncbi:MAG: MATE family efflux transporter, partial [Pseudomonadota bacterium]
GVMLFAHWGVSIPLGYILASTALITAPLGIIGWWYGLFTGVAVATIMLMFFVQRNLTTTGTN